MDDTSGTLNWLNESYPQEQANAIQQATRKKVFEVTRDPKTNRRIQI